MSTRNSRVQMVKNPHLKSFLVTLDERYPADSQSLSMSQWLFQHTKLRQKPFSTKDYEFQTQILDDLHPNLSCIKLSQVGLTESQFRKFFAFLKRNPGTSGIFSFPNQPMRDRVSQTRIKLMLETDKIWNGPLVAKPVRQKSIYQVDESYGYITGTTEGEATSIAADILMEDEVDLADQAMRGLMQSRLQNSDWKITQRFSTPTFEGYGIHAAYSVSDQHEFLFRCPCCRHWQTPDFQRRFLSIPGLPISCEDPTLLTSEQIQRLKVEEAQVVCEKCSTPLNLRAPETPREWVAKHPGRRGRGYRVLPFSTHKITISYIFDQLEKYIRSDNRRGFFNTVLGREYNDSNARISEQDIRICLDQAEAPTPARYAGYGDVFLGADIGQTCHVVIGRPDHIFEMAQVPQADVVSFIQNRCREYNIRGGGVDMYPYTPTAEQIRDLTHKVVMPVAYSTSPKAPAVVENTDEFDQLTHFVVNRTQSIDAVARRFRNHSWKLTGHEAFTHMVVSHIRDMIRIETPDQPPVWNKISGNDHFLHALANHQLAVRLKAGLDFQQDQRSSVFLGAGGRLFAPPQRGIYPGADAPFGVLG